jgi:hypothetical protein
MSEKEAYYKFVTDIVTIIAVVILVVYCVNAQTDDQTILILVAIIIGGEQLLRRYISTQVRDGITPTNGIELLLTKWYRWTEGLDNTIGGHCI